MAWVLTTPPEDASGELAAQYRRARNPDGSVDAVIQMHSASPASLRAHLELYVTAMHRPSALSRTEREIVGALVSAWNECRYCLVHHAAGLRRLLEPERAALADAIEGGDAVESLPLTDRERAMTAWARKLTMRPETAAQDDVGRLRAAGLDDRAIVELAQVVGYFAYVNRMVLGLGVELEGPEHAKGAWPTD